MLSATICFVCVGGAAFAFIDKLPIYGKVPLACVPASLMAALAIRWTLAGYRKIDDDQANPIGSFVPSDTSRPSPPIDPPDERLPRLPQFPG
jgi:hypothetical protein